MQPPPQQRLQVFLTGSYMLRANTELADRMDESTDAMTAADTAPAVWWRPEVASNTASLAEERAWSRQLELVYRCGSGSRWRPSLREEYNND